MSTRDATLPGSNILLIHTLFIWKKTKPLFSLQFLVSNRYFFCWLVKILYHFLLFKMGWQASNFLLLWCNCFVTQINSSVSPICLDTFYHIPLYIPVYHYNTTPSPWETSFILFPGTILIYKWLQFETGVFSLTSSRQNTHLHTLSSLLMKHRYWS